MKTVITKDDILGLEKYEAVRDEKRTVVLAMKKNRRVLLGPDATFYFENYDTMWWQIHEMLRIEKGGDEQVEDELQAFNPLIPQGKELVATFMLEIDDPMRRARVLSQLGGVEETLQIRFSGHMITAKAEEDIDRTTADGKASAIQFVHFHFTDDQIKEFCAASDIILECTHPNYAHKTLLPDNVHAELQKDFF